MNDEHAAAEALPDLPATVGDKEGETWETGASQRSTVAFAGGSHVRRWIVLAFPLLLFALACLPIRSLPGSTLSGSARWACPSPVPKPYGADGPVKAYERCNCSTDPISGAESCEQCPIYYEKWEQEYGHLGGPPFPAPTPYGRTGTSFRLGERVELRRGLHALVSAEAGAVISRSGVLSNTQQLYRLTLSWTNATGSSIAVDYARQLKLSAIIRPEGGIQSDTTWGLTAPAFEASGLPLPPGSIPPGESSVVVPIIAPPGQPKTIDLSDLARPGSVGGDWSVVGPSSLTPQQIDAILAAYGSPLEGYGQVFVDLGAQHDIDPAFALAFFHKENKFATATYAGQAAWAFGNIGNIRWTPGWPHGKWCSVGGGSFCFRVYESWEAGIKDWYRLLREVYVDQGLDTVDTILPVYAPASENDTALYIRQVKDLVTRWRGGSETGSGALRDETPQTVTIQWTAGELAGPACGSPGVLTNWASGSGNPVAVDAPDGAARVVQIALAQVGKPYVWGAKGPSAFDCSGLCTWSYSQVGVPIPQGTAGQWPGMSPVTQDQLQPGDLVFMDTSEPIVGAITHVGMLVGDLNGNGQWDMVHAASPALGVRVDYDIFASPYYAPRILGFRTAR
jgi:cell wall-associated NlpC family hydrolase